MTTETDHSDSEFYYPIEDELIIFTEFEEQASLSLEQQQQDDVNFDSQDKIDAFVNQPISSNTAKKTDNFGTRPM